MAENFSFNDDTQEVGCMLYKNIIESYAPECQEVTGINANRNSNRLELRQQVTNFMKVIAEAENDPNRRSNINAVIILANKLQLIELSYDALEIFLQEYFPQLKIKNVVEVLVTLGKAISMILSGSQELTETCQELTEVCVRRSTSFKERLFYLTVCYVQRVVCQYVRANGGWSVVMTECKNFAINNWPWLTAIAAVFAFAAGVGLTVVKIKKDNK